MRKIDTLLSARWVIPVQPAGVYFEHYSIAIDAGQILELLPTKDAKIRYEAREDLQFDEHALMPGLINAHAHAAMNLLRGLADDLPVMEWLEDHIWPAEQRFVSEAFVRDGTQHAVAEMLRGGITCFNDMYFFPEIAADVVTTSGIRANLGLCIFDFPTAWGTGPDDYFRKSERLVAQFEHHPHIKLTLAPHAPYTVSDGPLKRTNDLSREWGVQIQMHIHESAQEVEEALAKHGQRPLSRLADLQFLSPRLQAVHMTQITLDEIHLVKETGTHIIACPESNLKLASGFSPIAQFLDAGVNVALGTDGAASNNDLDMFSEMRTCAILAKAVYQNATAVNASTALQMATINGAKALGIADKTGSLEVGKAADIIAIDFNSIESTPLYNPLSQLVYATGRHQVSDVWVAGKQLLKNRELTTLNEKEIIASAREWREKIKDSR